MKLDEEKYHETKSIHPKRIFFGLLLLNAFLFLFVLLFKQDRIELTDDLSLQFITLDQLFNKEEIVVVDVDSVLQDITPLAADDTTYALSTADSLIKEPPIGKRIQYPDSTPNPLGSFFIKLLQTEKTGDLIRILHYGDSQLEGDRISDYLRNKFQLRFGGYGPGIILPIDISRSRISVRQSESPDWKKYAVYGKGKRLKNGYYGIGASSYKFDGKFAAKIGEDTSITKVFDIVDSAWVAQVDSTGLIDSMLQPVYDTSSFVWDTAVTPIYEERTVSNTYLRFRTAKRSYPRVRDFKNVRLLYSAEEPFLVNFKRDAIYSSITCNAAPVLNNQLMSDQWVNQEVMMSFKASTSPILYGVMLDGDSGVAVDNFPMRGSSGLGFEMINKRLYEQLLSTTNTSLIILQYGINVVPNPQKNYAYYARLMDAQLKAIRRAAPDISILVIGPSDMSRKRGGNYVTYPNIPAIRDAMKRAAFDNGCAFWDLYNAMGGENSMVAWVQNDPPLAAKDFTHFSSTGAGFVGEMLYNAIISKYIDWKKSQHELINEIPVQDTLELKVKELES